MARKTLQLQLAPGDIIGHKPKYQVVKRLGEGGCGTVYLCQTPPAATSKQTTRKDPPKEDRSKPRTTRRLAVKVLENPKEKQRFDREIKVMRAARGPHVVKCLDSGTHAGFPWLAMEYMAGGSLRDLLDREKRLSAEDAAWVIVQAARGLIASGTYHRDLKPENLLLTTAADGGRSRVLVDDGRRDRRERIGSFICVADFGLAKNKDGSNTLLTNSGQIMGTPLYMSPEQCRNTRDVTAASDIYALGVILYELVTGRTPFDGDNAYDIMTKQCNEEPVYSKPIDGRLRGILERCLAKDPKKRYRSLKALEAALVDYARLGQAPQDGSWLLWMLAAAGVVILGGLGWLLKDRILHNLGF